MTDTLIPAKKGKGIDAVIQSLHPQSLESRIEQRKVSSLFNLLLKRFEWSLEHKPGNIALRERADLEHWLRRRDITLTPPEINSFLQISAAYKDHDNARFLTGPFVSALIQRSYLAGYNNFQLDATSQFEPIHYLAYKLKGQDNDPLCLSVVGDVGRNFTDRSFRIDASLQGDAQYGSASCLYYSSLNVLGNVGPMFANGALWSVFRIDGKMKSSQGYDYIQHYCTFKSTNRHTLLDLLVETYVANKVCLIDENGVEHVWRDFK